jgi:predicted P-loop ATPase
LKGMRQGAVESLKAFLSRAVDRARPAYGRMVQEVPRQCVIVGTTNSDRYLRDGTGNRRFWPVRIQRFDLAALRQHREQLWAEAAMREAEGSPIRLPEHLWPAAAEQQEARRAEDPYVPLLRDALGDVCGKLRAADLWPVLDMPAGQRTQEHNMRLGEAMKELGWTRTKARFGGAPDWAYVRGAGGERVLLVQSGEQWRAVPESQAQRRPF